jgi:nucleotide-binding universal stress UspA family protein
LAATDLGDARYPVLFEAAEMARQLGRPMVALHNLAPRSVRRLRVPRPRIELPGGAVSGLRRQQLSNATRLLAPDAEMVIANELDPVDAILEQARTRNVDLIVVGTRAHSWFSRTLIGSVSTELVDRAIRSVLVTPLIELA